MDKLEKKIPAKNCVKFRFLWVHIICGNRKKKPNIKNIKRLGQRKWRLTAVSMNETFFFLACHEFTDSIKRIYLWLMCIDHKEMYIYKNVIKIKHELPLYIIINTTFTPFLL